MKSKKPVATILKQDLLELVKLRAKIKHINKDWLTYCCTCWLYSHWTNLQWWHFIPQWKGNSCKFELDGCNQQCAWCNAKCNQWEQFKHWQYIDKTYWEWRADELHAQSRLPKKWTIMELEMEIEKVIDLISSKYRSINAIQQWMFIHYIIKDWSRKRKCKLLLSNIWYEKER